MYKNTNKIGLLFVCLGNICRSPAAEEIMRQIVIKHNREKDFFYRFVWNRRLAHRTIAGQTYANGG